MTLFYYNFLYKEMLHCSLSIFLFLILIKVYIFWIMVQPRKDFSHI